MRAIRRWALGLLIALGGCAGQSAAGQATPVDPIGTALAGRPTEPPFDSAATSEAGVAVGLQARTLASAGELDLWTEASGGEKVYERPKLLPGSLVVVEAIEPQTTKVRTEEDVVGWIREPASRVLTKDLALAGPALGVQPGARVKIVRPVGVPVRIAARSTADELRKNVPAGTAAVVLAQRGDWLRVRFDDKLEGWVRWYYDGEQIIVPAP